MLRTPAATRWPSASQTASPTKTAPEARGFPALFEGDLRRCRAAGLAVSTSSDEVAAVARRPRGRAGRAAIASSSGGAEVASTTLQCHGEAMRPQQLACRLAKGAKQRTSSLCVVARAVRVREPLPASVVGIRRRAANLEERRPESTPIALMDAPGLDVTVHLRRTRACQAVHVQVVGVDEGAVDGPPACCVLADTHLPKRAPRPARRGLGRRSTPPTSWCTPATGSDVALLDALEERSGAADRLSTATTTDPALRGPAAAGRAAPSSTGVRLAVVHETGPADRAASSGAAASYPGHRRAGLRAQPHPVGHHARRPALRLLNPGSPTDRRRQPDRTYGVLTLDAGRIEWRLHRL